MVSQDDGGLGGTQYGVDQADRWLAPSREFCLPGFAWPIQVKQAWTVLNGTGGAVSDAGEALVRWLCSEAGAEVAASLRGATVLELGCGLGLVSAVVALLGAARVVATDTEDEVLGCVPETVASAKARDGCVIPWRLSWGEPVQWPAEIMSSDFSLVLGADILYNPEKQPELADTLRQVLLSNPGCRILLAWVDRGAEEMEFVISGPLQDITEAKEVWHEGVAHIVQLRVRPVKD